jgi:hypothetical protein
VRLIEPAPAWLPAVLQIVTRDVELARQVSAKVATARLRALRVALRDAGAPGPDEDPPTVLLDLRAGAATIDDLKAVRRARPRAPLLVLGGPTHAPAALYAAGATAVVPSDPEVLAACALSLTSTLRDSSREAAIESGLAEGFGRVHRLMHDLRSGLLSSSMALNVMAVVSERAERAVLFMARRNDLRALGAFGAAADAQPLAEATKDLVVPASGAGALLEGLDDGHMRTLLYDERRLPLELAQILGPPRTGQAAVFPILGGQSLISVLYVDNGGSPRALDRLESIEIATAQIGMAFENQQLRRQLGGRAEPSELRAVGR